jgi:hypothetical protein
MYLNRRDYELLKKLHALFSANQRFGGEVTFKTPVVTVTTTSHTASTDGPEIIFVDDDTAGAAVTIALPTAVGNSGLRKIIKKVGNTATVTIDPSGSQTIDGATTLAINTQFESFHIASNGAGWYIL